MGKVPVGRSISEGYRFLAMRLGAWIGLGWLPAAFYGAAVWFCLRWLGQAMQVAVPSSSLFNEFTAVVYLALLLATAILVPAAAVPYAALALGQKRDHVAAHFVYGGREFRLTLALMGFYLVLIAVVAALGIAAQFAIGVGLPKPGESISGFAMPAEWMGLPFSLWLDGAVAVILGFAALFVSVRFGFYLPALAAAEDHVTLGHAWALSRGSFWRLAVVQAALAIPVSLAVAGAVWLIEGSALADVFGTAWSRVPSEGMGAIVKLQYDHAAALAAVWAVGMAATSFLFASASATAYRVAVLGEEVSEPETVERDDSGFVPAWGGAPAMADAGPRWRSEPSASVMQPVSGHAVPAETVEAASEPIIIAEQIHGWHPDAQAYASDAAATAVAQMEPVAPMDEGAVEHHAAEADAAVHEAQPAPDTLAAFASDADAVHAAPDAGPAEAAPEHAAEAAPPLDPAGAAAAIAMQEQSAAS